MRARETGVSLLELLLVVILFGTLAAAAAPLLYQSLMAYVTGKDIAETDWQARVAAERMTRELRAIRSPADLTITSASDITFIDLDGNAIRYCMGAVGGCPGTAGELMRNGQPLAAGITGLTFSFLTRTAAATAVPAQVYYVSIAYTATQNNVAKSYSATVSPRNFP